MTKKLFFAVVLTPSGKTATFSPPFGDRPSAEDWMKKYLGSNPSVNELLLVESLAIGQRTEPSIKFTEIGPQFSERKPLNENGHFGMPMHVDGLSSDGLDGTEAQLVEAH